MPRKATKMSLTPGSDAERVFRSALRIRHSAQALLDNLGDLLDTVHRYGARRSRVYELHQFQPEQGPVRVYRIEPAPSIQLVAEYIAYLETEFWPDLTGPMLDFIEDMVTGRRASVVVLSDRTFASALRTVRMLSEAPIPIPEDVFNVWPLHDHIRWGIMAKHKELASVEDRSVPRLNVHPSLQRGYDSLTFALVCGLEREEAPAKSWLSDRHRLLARLIAEDKQIPKLLRAVRVRRLHDHLSSIVSATDLPLIREELLLEFAAVIGRIPELVAQVEARSHLFASSRPGARPRKKAPDPRRAFAYKLVCDTAMTLKAGVLAFNARADNEGWDEIGSIQGLRDMAATYAADFNHPRPPSRYSK